MKITPREREVVALVQQGFNDKEIANTLNLSPGTVRHHLRMVYLRTGIEEGSKRVALVRALEPKAEIRFPDTISFTETERAIAEMACSGLSNRQIAARIGRSVGVTRNLMIGVMNKTGTWSRLELATRFTTTV